jgi:hypothetical protein
MISVQQKRCEKSCKILQMSPLLDQLADGGGKSVADRIVLLVAAARHG